MSCIEIGDFKYYRSSISDYLEDISDVHLMNDYYNYSENELQALCVIDTIPNRNKYVSFRIYQLVKEGDMTTEDEFQLMKWLYIEYYMKNRKFVVDNLEKYARQLLIQKMKQLRRVRFIPFQIYYKISKRFDIKVNNLNSSIENCSHIMEKIHKEKNEIITMMNYVCATVSLKNTCLFNQLKILQI